MLSDKKMAITKGNHTIDTARIGLYSFSHNNDKGENNAVVVAVSYYYYNAYPTAVTYGGQVMSLVKRQLSGGTYNSGADIYILTNAPSGANNVQITWSSGSGANTRVGVAVTLNGIDQSSPVYTTSGQGSASSSASSSVSIATDSGGFVIDALQMPGSSGSPSISGAGQLYLVNNYLDPWGNGNSYRLGLGVSVVMSWTLPTPNYQYAHAIASFKEAPKLPVIESSPTVGGIFSTGAVGHANITSDNGFSITERGWVVNTSANPTISHTKFTTAGTTGEYDTTISGLLPETHYYARPFATNSEGTSYGDQVEFTTISSFSPHIIGSLVLAVAVMI